VVLAHGWASPGDLPGGIERDEFDDVATHLAAWDGATLVATGRLVYPAPGRTFPTEAHFEFTCEDRELVVNLDRMAVAPGYADPGHRLFIALAYASWLEIRPRGFHTFLGVISPAVARIYRRVGWDVTVLGPPREYWGE